MKLLPCLLAFWCILCISPSLVKSQVLTPRITWYENNFSQKLSTQWWQVHTAESCNWEVSAEPGTPQNQSLQLKSTESAFQEVSILTSESIDLSRCDEMIQLNLDLQTQFSSSLSQLTIEIWDGESWKIVLNQNHNFSGVLSIPLGRNNAPDFKFKFVYQSPGASQDKISIDNIKIQTYLANYHSSQSQNTLTDFRIENASESIRLISEVKKEGKIYFSIFQMDGKLRLKGVRSLFSGTNTIEISTASLSSGMYYIQVRTPGGFWTQNIVLSES